MNYEIIKDESLLKQFIKYLPELDSHEKFYVCLMARKKYCPSIKSDKASLKRFISDKKHLVEKIRQLETVIGTYSFNGEPIPQEALALYITPNPRDIVKGTINVLKKFVDLVTKPYDGYNPHSEVLTTIHQSPSKKTFVDFDYDGVNIEETISLIKTYINEEAFSVLVTKGGIHVLVTPSKISKEHLKTWYLNLSKIKGCDVRGDTLIPIPGCTQGNFVPYFISKYV